MNNVISLLWEKLQKVHDVCEETFRGVDYDEQEFQIQEEFLESKEDSNVKDC